MGLNKSCLFNAARYSILDMEYGVQISGIGGWGAELNREIVSCRACVRGVYVSQESSATRVRLMGSLEVTPGRNKYDVGSYVLESSHFVATLSLAQLQPF